MDTMHQTAVGLFNEKKEALSTDEAAFQNSRKDFISVLSGHLRSVCCSTCSIDFGSLLVHANSKVSEEERLPDDQVLAQITQVISDF